MFELELTDELHRLLLEFLILRGLIVFLLGVACGCITCILLKKGRDTHG